MSIKVLRRLRERARAAERRRAGRDLRRRRQDRRDERPVRPVRRSRRARARSRPRAWRSRTSATSARASRSCRPTTRTSPTSAPTSSASGSTSTASTRSSMCRPRRSRSRSPRSSREKNKVFLVSGAATTQLTGEACSPNTIHWTYDTYALAVGTGRAMVQEGGDSWFFITADYAFGHQLEDDTSTVVKEEGGEVLGAVRHPLELVGLLVLPAAGAGLGRQGDRARERRQRHHQRDQAGPRVRHHPGRPAARRRCCCSSPTSTRSASRSRRAWC